MNDADIYNGCPRPIISPHTMALLALCSLLLQLIIPYYITYEQPPQPIVWPLTKELYGIKKCYVTRIQCARFKPCFIDGLIWHQLLSICIVFVL